MKVALVGGSGRIGKRVAQYAVERGHEIKSFNRHPERVELKGIETVKGDVAELSALTGFFKGSDVIVYAVTVLRSDPPAYVQGVKNALQAAKDAGVSRIVFPNNYSTLKLMGEEIVSLFALPPQFNKVIPAFKEALSVIREEKELDWLVVTGPAVTKIYHDVTGKYLVESGDEMIIPDPELGYKSSIISMEDYANFILDQAEGSEYNRERITVCNPYEIWKS